MSEKKIKMMVDSNELLRAAVIAFTQCLEHDGKYPVSVPLGQVNGVAFEMGVYDVERMVITEEADQQLIEVTLDNPVVYEQLNLDYYGTNNDSIH